MANERRLSNSRLPRCPVQRAFSLHINSDYNRTLHCNQECHTRQPEAGVENRYGRHGDRLVICYRHGNTTSGGNQQLRKNQRLSAFRDWEHTVGSLHYLPPVSQRDCIRCHSLLLHTYVLFYPWLQRVERERLSRGKTHGSFGVHRLCVLGAYCFYVADGSVWIDGLELESSENLYCLCFPIEQLRESILVRHFYVAFQKGHCQPM